MSANQRDVEAEFELLIEQVDKGFELLIEEVDRGIELANIIVNDASQNRDYRTARWATDKAESLDRLRRKLEELRRKWPKLRSGRRPRLRKATQRSPRKARRGERTPEKDYYVPILEALVELGGRGEAHKVLQLVERKMKPILKPIDYEFVRPGEERWRNTARWARDRLVKRGLMKPPEKKGFWEISSEGRAWLEKAQQQRGQEQGNTDGSSENENS